LAGNFAAGVVPTGSADPFGLRRQALGVLRILLEKQLPIDLSKAIEAAINLQPVGLDAARKSEVAAALADFIWARAQSFFEEIGFKTDEIRSVRAGAFKSLPRTLLRLTAVRNLRKVPDFEPLAAAFKRASNILRQAKVSPEDGQDPDRSVLCEKAELALYDTLAGMEGLVRERIAENQYELGLKTLVAIKPQLDSFFESVMVMADDPGLRRERLGLLARLVRLFNAVADLSELQAPSPN
jgi:glycyl-tRNA synthetase beta chain